MTDRDWTPERFEQIADFQGTRLVIESAWLDVYGHLAAGPLDAAELAERLQLHDSVAPRFFDALAGLGLLEKEGQLYRNSESASRYLAPSSPDYLGHLLIAARDAWDLWIDLPIGLRTGKRQRERLLFVDRPEATRHLLLAVHRSARSRAADILDRGYLDLEGRRRMLDLGSGTGTYSVAFCRNHPELEATLVDRSIAAALARDVIASAGLEDRVSVIEQDLDEGELPTGADFAWISNVFHSRAADANRRLLQRAYSCLEPGGQLTVQDLIMEESRTTPATGAVFSIHMLLANGVGRCYTIDEIRDWITEAGFRDPRWIRDEDEDLSLIVADR